MPATPTDSPQSRAAPAVSAAAISVLAAELGTLFASHGHQLALVGGPVRDVFLGRPASDLDLTTDAPPERTLEIIGRWADHVWPVGIAYGTIGARKGDEVLEITTYRTERYAAQSRNPQVKYETSLAEDLSRRDFTVNAVAVTLPDGAVVDPYGGLRDLADKVLRTPRRPEDSFGDDPLRILRAARFVAQLGLRPAPGLRAAMTKTADRLSIVSAERIGAELGKLVQAQRPGGPVAGIALLVETGVADRMLPEVSGLRLEVDEHHRHKDVYRHSLTVLDQAIALEPRYGLGEDLRLRLAALLHDIGKPATRTKLPGGRVAFHHHDVKGAAMARSRLKALRFPGDLTADVARLIELHLRFHGYPAGEWTDAAVRRYVTDAGPLLSRLHALTRADCTTRNKAKADRLARAYDGLEQRIAELAEQEQLASIRPDLDGHEIMRLLGIAPGPLVGRAHAYLLELRMEHGPLGTERATQELLRWAEAEGLGPPATPDLAL